MVRRARTHTRLFIAAALASLAVHALAGGPSKYLVARPPAVPFDAVIVPGCPSRSDGSLSFCQLGRAGQAALLWRQGWTTHFIVSGAAVHTPYVEAEAIAEAMTVLGVPADRIVLERDALHSDENVYYSMRVADGRGLHTLAVASNEPIGSWMCGLMTRWGHACSSIDMDTSALRRLMPAYEARLRAVRAARVEGWEPLDRREARIARHTGHARPPSFVYYPLYRWLGRDPIAPAHAQAITWAERAAELAR